VRNCFHAILKKAKPIGRWRKVTGLRGLEPHDSGTTGIQSYSWTASVVPVTKSLVIGTESVHDF